MALPAARARKENAALLVSRATPVLMGPLVLMVLEDKLVSPAEMAKPDSLVALA